MLPMTLQFIIVMIASAVNDRLQRKLDYVEEERRILREQLDAATGGKRLSFTTEQRRRLATAGKLLTPDERRKCCELVRPATIHAWFRELAARKYDSSESRRGRPPKPKDVRKLVIKLATENPSWGYTKIRDALRTGLGIEIGRTTVANILAEAGVEPAPGREKTRTWKQFMKAHWDSLCGCDFSRRGTRSDRNDSLHQDARRGDRGHRHEPRRTMDAADRTQPDRLGGRLASKCDLSDPRPGSVVHRGVRSVPGRARGEVREDFRRGARTAILTRSGLSKPSNILTRSGLSKTSNTSA
jgi:transposase